MAACSTRRQAGVTHAATSGGGIVTVVLVVATGLQPIHRNAGTPDVPYTIENDPRVSKSTRELYAFVTTADGPVDPFTLPSRSEDEIRIAVENLVRDGHIRVVE